jgi:phage terminase small subunit
MTLRPKQERFIEEYLIDFNATQAAIRSGYSVKTAAIQGHENLRKPNIIAALNTRQAEIAASREITPERVAAEYAALGFSDITDYMSWGPEGLIVKSMDELPEGATKAISEVTENFSLSQGRTFKIKLHDKKAALDSLCRMMGWNAPEKHEPPVIIPSITINIEERVAQYVNIARSVARGEITGDANGHRDSESLDTPRSLPEASSLPDGDGS